MKSTVVRKGLTASVILGLGAILSACGGGGSSAASGGSTSTNDTITGYTVDGPFSASIGVYGFRDNSPVLCGIGTSLSSNSGYFSISLNSNCSGPYLISATASSGTNAGDVYYYLAAQPVQNIYVTPASTAIVEANVKGNNSTTAILSSLSSFISSSSSILSSIEQQESQYSSSSISFTHVFFPYSLSSSQGTSLIPIGVAMEEFIYPLLPSSNYKNVPVLIKDYALGNLNSNTYLAFPMGTLSGTLSEISNTVLSLTLPPYSAESITFSGNLNNPLSLSILGLLTSFSNYSQTFYSSPPCSSSSVCNSSSTVSAIVNYSGYEFITNGNGLESITSISNGTSNYGTSSFTIISSIPIAQSSSCSTLSNTTMLCNIFGNPMTISIQPGPSQGTILKGPFVSPFLFLNNTI